MATAATSLQIDETRGALARAYRQDVSIEAAAFRAFTQAQHDLILAKHRRIVSENAYRRYSGVIA